MNKKLFIYSILFYLLFVVVRIFGLLSFDVQPDEVHWLDRSYKVLALFQEGHYSQLTTHLGQPGIVPSLFMALGQGVGNKINSHFNLHPGDVYYFHPLYYCRLACLLVSSLVVFPLLMIGSVFFELRVMFMACFLFALSPHHIGLSRLAHLDAVMTVTVVSSFLFYMLALRTGLERFKLIAGLFWGLSIATKPTALSLVFAFLVMGFYDSYFVKRKGLKDVISVYDLWAVLIGHIVFTLLYTRIWVHESDYLLRLHIESGFADFIYFIGTNYSLIGQIFSLSLLVYCFIRYKNHGNKTYLYLIFFSFLFDLLFIFPAEAEGLVRFWGWTFGLSSMPHKAYGKVWEGEKGGYLALLLYEIPLVILSLLAFNFITLGKTLSVNKNFSPLNRKRLYLFLIFSIWVAILSTSSKQTLRYILPVLPCLYVLAADSVWQLFDALSAKISWLRDKGIIFCLIFIIPQCFAVVSTHPNQVVFYNALGGGIEGVVKRGGVHYLIGVNKLVAFLREKALSSSRKQSVYVGGELAVPRLAYDIQFPGINEMKFLAPLPLMWGSYFIRYHHLDEAFFNPVPSGIDVNKPEYEVKLGTNTIASLYRVRAPDLRDPYFVNITKLHRKIGADKMNQDIGAKVIELVRKRDRKGFPFFTTELEFPRGTYQFGVHAKLLNKSSERVSVLEVQFGSCKEIIYSDQLNDLEFKPAFSQCKVNELDYRAIKIYWFRKADVELSTMSIQRLGD